ELIPDRSEPGIALNSIEDGSGRGHLCGQPVFEVGVEYGRIGPGDGCRHGQAQSQQEDLHSLLPSFPLMRRRKVLIGTPQPTKKHGAAILLVCWTTAPSGRTSNHPSTPIAGSATPGATSQPYLLL